VYLLIRKKRAGILLCSAAWLPPLALLLIVNLSWTETRYAIISLPFWIILSAVAVRELFVRADGLGKMLSLGVLLLLVADPLSQDVIYYRYQNGQRPDYRAAYALVEQEKGQDDLVLASTPIYGHYYLSDEVKGMNAAAPADLEAAGKRVWFAFGPEYYSITPELERWIHENAGLVQVFEIPMPGKSLSIYVYLYDPASTPQ
jgi:hypothetical protein